MELGQTFKSKGFTVQMGLGHRYTVVQDPDGKPMQMDTGKTKGDAEWMCTKLAEEQAHQIKAAFRAMWQRKTA